MVISREAGFQVVVCNDVGEADKDEGGEVVRYLVGIEADGEATASAIESQRDYIVIVDAGFHNVVLSS